MNAGKLLLKNSARRERIKRMKSKADAEPPEQEVRQRYACQDILRYSKYDACAKIMHEEPEKTTFEIINQPSPGVYFTAHFVLSLYVVIHSIAATAKRIINALRIFRSEAA
jgi:hypothetical protein